jgi:hypothetical protein
MRESLVFSVSGHRHQPKEIAAEKSAGDAKVI